MATYLENLENEYLFWPNSQTGCLNARRNEGETFDDLNSALLQMDLTKAASQFGGIQLEGDEKAWLIPVSLIVNASEVRNGDRIYEALEADIDEDSVFWTITNAKKVRFNTQWMVVGVKSQ